MRFLAALVSAVLLVPAFAYAPPAAAGGGADLALDKRHVDPFVHGQPAAWRIVVANFGVAATAGPAVVRDTLPAGIGFLGGTGAGWSFAIGAGGVVTATHADPIAAGDSAAFTLNVAVGALAVPGVINRAQVELAGDLDPANDLDADTTAVETRPDLGITKLHAGTFQVGVNGRYDFVVRNFGQSPTTGAITVTDTLPAGLAFVSGSGAGWTFAATDSIVTATRTTSLAAGSAAAASVTVAVGPAAAPGVVNAATVRTANDVNPANDRALDPTVVEAGSPDLALDKRHVAPFVHGQPGAWSFVVTNAGTAPTSGPAVVRDTLPAGIGFVAGSGTGWTVSADAGVVTATHAAAIAPGDSAAFAIDVSVGALALPGVVNRARVETPGDLDPSDDADADTTAVESRSDLSLVKRHLGAFTVGTPGVYDFVIRNFGPSPTSGAITVVDTLPPGLTFVSGAGAGWTFGAVGSIVLASHPGPLAPAQALVASITVAVAPAALPGVENAATVQTANDPNPNNDRATDVTVINGVPDLEIDKRHTAPFVVGGTAAWTIVVHNRGTGATTGPVVVRDTLPAGATFVSGDGPGWTVTASGPVIVATLEDLVGEQDSTSFTLTATLDATALPAVANAAVVTTAGDPNPANDRDVDVAAVAGLPDLVLDKSHVGVFRVGSTGTYTFRIRNQGTGPAGPITVRDTLPAGLTYVSGAGSGWTVGADAGEVVAIFEGPLAPGALTLFSIEVAISAAALPAVTNIAFAAVDGDPNPDDNGDHDLTLVQGLPDLAIDKRHTTAFRVGEHGVYTIVVHNLGSGNTTAPVTVRDTLPDALTLVGVAGEGWHLSANGRVVTALLDSWIPAGDSAAFTITVRPERGSVPAVTNAATVDGGGDEFLANNRDVDVASVTGEGALELRLDASPREVELGGVVDYQVRVIKQGTGPVVGLQVTATLPPGFRLLPGTSTFRNGRLAEPAGAPGPTLRWSLPEVAGLVTYTLAFRVEAGAGADLGNGLVRASATGRNGDLGGAVVTSNAAAAAVTVRPGVFGDEAIVSGKVFADTDCDADGMQGPEDVGIPGVRVYLEDGTSAVTDAEGKYHFEHVRPRMHVVRVDESTLPAGARLAARTSRHGAGGRAALADVKRGELHRVDFAVDARDAATAGSLRLRRRGPEGVPVESLDSAAVRGPERRGRFGVLAPSMLALGVLHARFDWRSLAKGELGGTRRDRFEDALRDARVDSDDGTLAAAVRGALFATGTLRDSVRLTLRFDSERDPERRLFRDIRPLEGYDLFGDASTPGFEARSDGRAFARIERGRSFAQYGDFATPHRPELVLGAFSRRLEGGIARAAVGGVAVTAFGASHRQRQIVDEIPAQGVSGPYALSRADGTLGSELVEILVRDRNQPAIVLSREPKLRFADYTIEPFTGRLLFRHPIPSVDANLNPVSIRVTYESASGGDRFGVYGGEAEATLGRFTFGGSAAQDDDPLRPAALVSAHATFRIAERLAIAAEAARSDSGGGFRDGVTFGDAGRVELRYADARFDARVHAMGTEIGFHNPSSGVAPGREESGLTMRAAIDSSTTAFVNGLRTKDLRTRAHRDGVEAGASRALGSGITLEGAYRWAEERAPAEARTRGVTPIEVSAARGTVRWKLPTQRTSSVFAEYEQDLEIEDQHRGALGGDLQLSATTRLYARHENISSFAGPFALNPEQHRTATVIGIARHGERNGHVFSEYRLRDAFAGREAQAAVGLRHRWTVAEGVHLDGGFERVTVFQGFGKSTAVSGGVEYLRDPLWKGTARVEWHKQFEIERWLATAGMARKLSRDWAALGRLAWHWVPDEERADGRHQLGLAFRETERDRWNALARYEYRYEKARVVFDDERRTAHVLSAHGDWRAAPRWLVNGRVAGKWAHDENDALSSHTGAQLVAGRGRVDLGRALDAGLALRGLFAGARTFGAGGEVGWRVAPSLRVAAGYNVFGFRDEALSGLDRTDHGFYLDFGLQLDEAGLGLAAPAGAPR